MQGRSSALGYGLGVASVVLAVALSMASDPVLGDRTPFIFFFPAVLVTSWYAGRAAALLAVVLGAVATYFMFPLHNAAEPDLSIAYTAGLAVFLTVSIAMIELTMGMRRAQSRAQASAERLDLALAAGNMGVWEWDLVTNEVWWSDSLEPVHGLPHGAFGRTIEAFRQLIYSEDRAKVDEALGNAIETRGEYEVEFRFLRPDGSVRWMTATGRVFSGEAGKPGRMVGTARDVTDHHEAAGALREAAGRFEAVMTHAPFVVFAKDGDGRYLMVNQAFAQLAGVSEDDIVGKTDAELFSPHVAAAFIRCDAQVLSSGKPRQYEEVFTHDGATYTFLTIKFPLRGGDGAPSAVCGIANDITAHKEAEASLKDADRRKDEFLAILAHELRNPLAPVRLALELVRMNRDDKAISDRAMDVMGRQLVHLVRLIDDLLDVSRITRGKLELRRARVMLADVVRTALETSRPQIDGAGHQLSVSLPDQPVELHADLTRLAQVISNLLNNAAKYTPRGGTIQVDAAVDRDQLAISVTDTGIGLAPHHVRGVFEMFAQVGPLTTRGQGGLGIGLALARALVEMHGGRIEASSPGEGKGSTFTVHLPVAQTVEDFPVAPERPTPVPTRLRVLVADDNRDATETLTVFLEQVGHTVRTANDGLEAFEAAAVFHPDVCVLDIGMPRMDGYEVARKLRAAGSGVVLIALTGWGQAEDHRRSREAGFDFHLIKPVQPSTLVKLLATAGRGS